MQTSKLGTTLIMALSILGLTDARAAGPYIKLWSDVMTTLHPDRVIAVWMRSGSALMFLSHPEFARPEVPATLYKIPMMTNPGVKEKPKTPPPDPDTRREGERHTYSVITVNGVGLRSQPSIRLP